MAWQYQVDANVSMKMGQGSMGERVGSGAGSNLFPVGQPGRGAGSGGKVCS